MENWQIDDSVLAELPIFPLEKAHLFPGAVLPLHIFEPRYVEMLQDTLDSGKNTIAIAEISRGVVPGADAVPVVEPIMGVGVVFAAEKLEGERWNVLLRGVGRVRMLHELETSKAYRLICAKALDEVGVETSHPLHGQLRSLLGQLADVAPEAKEVLHVIMSQGKTPSALTNLLGAHATADPQLRRRMLHETHVERRLALAVRHIGQTLLERLEPDGDSTSTLH